jgi:hypothetical protein
MLGSIIVALIIMSFIIYCLYQWLEWGKKYQESLLIWQSIPYALDQETKVYLDQYGALMPANYLVDTYKYLYFWVQYFLAWMSV